MFFRFSLCNQKKSLLLLLCGLFALGLPQTLSAAEPQTFAYGSDDLQQLDLYLPDQLPAPGLIVMVHGGGWHEGDKANRPVLGAKLDHFLARGYAFASLNYRLMPKAAPATQAQDVAAAIAFLQENANSWGVNPDNIVVIGHSSGAHLVALLSSVPALMHKQGATPWRGSVLLDTAALDVPTAMSGVRPRFYRDSFGRNPNNWVQLSPLHQLKPDALPMLVVCSSLRRDLYCEVAESFVNAATDKGVYAELYPVELKHKAINVELGEPSAYTDTVDSFIDKLMR